MNIELPDKDRFTLREVAGLLDKHVSTIWRWVLKKGVRGRRLRSIHVGGQRYVLRCDLDKFLNPEPPVDQSQHSQDDVSTANFLTLDRIEAELDDAGI